jgi:4-hydroxy-tetrahydrodipicolinate reductase
MSETTPLILFGAAGRMGRMIAELAVAAGETYSIAGAVERADHPQSGRPFRELAPGVADSLELAAAPPDNPPAGAVAMHFALPPATMAYLEWSCKHGMATLIGTTGFSEPERRTIADAGEKIAVLLTPNTSRGVNVLFWLARQATRLLGPDYDIEIVEMHHHHKKDAPSGTARRLAEVVLEERNGSYRRDVRHGRAGDVGARAAGEVGMHALRGGDVIGEHTVLLTGRRERIELTHRALGRELLAQGALDAARWLSGRKPGCYTMNDMLGL